MDRLVVAANVICWGSVVVVWVAGALYNASHPQSGEIRGEFGPLGSIIAVSGAAIVLIVGRRLADPVVITATWARLLGLALLVVSTAFAIRARLVLGTSWSVNPVVGGDRRLRTTGPYAVTRHPIYTGLLGMVTGSALLAGGGQWLALVAVGLLVAAMKIRSEERLLLASFPDEYAAYRERVPQLVPGLRALHPRPRGTIPRG